MLIQAKVTLFNGHQETYIVKCELTYIFDKLEDDYDVKPEDIRLIEILRVSSTAAIRQGKR